jgi:energy-coupling factor transporter transmembrane protein EcfT
VHALPPAWKLAGAFVLSALTIAVQGSAGLLVLVLANLLIWWLARLPAAALWRDTRWLLAQGALIVLLYALRDGGAGLGPGLRVAVRIALFFVPAAVVLRTTQLSDALRDLRRWLPRELAFIVYASLRFVPFFARELREIAEAQRLRGLSFGPRSALNPRRWPELYQALAVPLAVRAVKVAGEAAIAAEARGLRLAPEPQFPEGVRVRRRGSTG